MIEKTYLRIKPSQVTFFKEVPFYCQTKEGDYILNKESGKKFTWERLKESNYPQLYIDTKDKDVALNELTNNLNLDLAR